MDKRVCTTHGNVTAPAARPVPPSVLWRLHRALGPIAGGMILDFVDLTTFGPLGIVGLFLGAAVGWWISSIYDFPPRIRAVWALLAGIYCLMPMTALLPVATIISAVARFDEKLPVGDQGRGAGGEGRGDRMAAGQVARVK